MNHATHVSDTIGNTPLVKLSRLASPDGADVFVKLEYFNPTGSYKDRMAIAIIEEAEKRGDIKEGKSIVEFTGGSTGTSLAFVCALKGYPFTAITSDAFAKEKLQSIRLFGASLEIIPSDGGKITPDLFVRMNARVQELVARGAWWTKQFENKDAMLGYRKLGQEIVTQLGRPAEIFCAAVGTAGMLVGAGSAIKAQSPDCRLVALEPSSSPMLTLGHGGSHRVEGTATGRIPQLLQEISYEALAIEESEAREVARALAREEGIFAGTSTGLNVAAAIRLARGLKPGQAVVTVAADSGMKYLAGDLFG